jgi:hypothetical protein
MGTNPIANGILTGIQPSSSLLTVVKFIPLLRHGFSYPRAAHGSLGSPGWDMVK